MYLEQYADQNFSGFEGELEAYTGENDDFLNFDGPGKSFANERATQRNFTIVITNTDTVAKKIVILNGYKGTSVESGELLLVEGALDGVTAKWSATGSPASITELTEFLKHVPAHLGGFRIQSTLAGQIQQTATIEELSPFKKLGSKEIFMGAYTDERTYRDNMVTVPTPGTVLGSETKFSIPVLPGSTVTITLFVGAMLSNSVGLKNKHSKAVKSITAVGVDNVRKAQTLAVGQ